MKKVLSFLFHDHIIGPLQILLAWFYAIPQIMKLWDNRQGITITLYILFTLFPLLNLTISIGDLCRKFSRGIAYACAIYLHWTVFCAIMLTECLVRGVPWEFRDTIFMSIVGVSFLGLVMYAYLKGISLKDQLIRGIMSGICKTAPQLYLAYSFWVAKSGAGYAAAAIWIAHLTAALRIIQIVNSGKSIQEEKSKKLQFSRGVWALLLAETGNALSWIVVTIIWLMY